MIKLTVSSLIALVAMTLMSFTATPQFEAVALVTLRAGTAVSLTLNQEVNANDFSVGNTVEFLVKTNVTVNGQVVIAAGSPAEGMIKDVVKSCEKGCKEKRCSKIIISVETAQSVDGQSVLLNSIPLTVQADCCCNEAAVAKIGTSVSAKVRNDININA
ncbi:MAG: hypothetical protein HC892_03930 [Saprospiraceae bacterium]|nr:hypothetical protein [Saprospiraceae bacterium]